MNTATLPRRTRVDADSTAARHVPTDRTDPRPPPLADSPPEPITVEEFWEFGNRPENRHRHLELDEGRIVEMPGPKPLHGVLCGRINRALGRYLDARGAGELLPNDTGLVLGRDPDTLRGPDVMVFPRTLDVDALAAADRYFEGDGEMPALVVEVPSPSNRPVDIDRKVTQYLSAGVPRVWVVDPPARTVTVHRPDADPHPVPAAGTLDGGDALPGLSVPVAAVFGG